MNNYNWLLAELMAAQRARELEGMRKRVEPERAAATGMRQMLASAFVRLGMRLDPAAGERAHALTLPVREAR